MAAAIVLKLTEGLKPHPNDLDKKRIERALKARKRYRYVTPNVLPAPEGYRIESPCCSRNIDAEGGTIDVALLTYDAEPRQWRLHHKDHTADAWVFHSVYDRLPALLDRLNEDEERIFWQ